MRSLQQSQVLAMREDGNRLHPESAEIPGKLKKVRLVIALQRIDRNEYGLTSSVKAGDDQSSGRKS